MQRDPSFTALSRALRQRERLLEAVRAHLPADVRAHCVGARREADRLILHAESAVWALRLRLATPALLAAAPHGDAPLTSIQVRVAPPAPPVPTSAAAPRPHLTLPGPAVPDQLEQTAAGLPPGALAQSLTRLAQTLRAARQARSAGPRPS